MNNKFKGLYDNEKTSFMTDRTNDGFYKPEIKTQHIQVHNYSINFDKKELYAEIDRLNKECDTYMKIATKRGNIIEELEKHMKSLYIVGHTINNATLDSIFYKLKELKEGNKC